MKRTNNLGRRNFLRKSIIAATGLVIGAKAVKMLADYEHSNGILEILNHLDHPPYQNQEHKIIHRNGGLNREYGDIINDDDINAKIISRIPDYELMVDTRPIDSISPVDLELNLVSPTNSPIEINSSNELWCSFGKTPNLTYDFGKKPICLYRVHDEGLEFLADVREGIAKSPTSGILKLPLPRLEGIFKDIVKKMMPPAPDGETSKTPYWELREPYARFQVRFEFPGDFNMDGKVNMKDMGFMNRWLADPDPNNSPIANITSDPNNGNGLPDDRFDGWDLQHWSKDYLKDINDPNTW